MVVLERGPMQGKIWVVEDSNLLRTHLKNFLTGIYNFEIEEFPSVKKLESAIQSQGVQDLLLMILDVHLEDGNGLEVIESYNRLFSQAKIPFVVISSIINQDVLTRAVDAGAKDVFRKPIDLNMLSKRIDSVIAERYGVVGAKRIEDFCSPVALEIKRASRGAYGLTLLVVKLFDQRLEKLLYQTNGFYDQHLLSKNCLQHLQCKLRETDTVVELSPSEFLFVLPFANADGAPVVRKKIEVEIENIVHESTSTAQLVSGVAVYPNDGEKVADLVEKIEERIKERVASFATVPN